MDVTFGWGFTTKLTGSCHVSVWNTLIFRTVLCRVGSRYSRHVRRDTFQIPINNAFKMMENL
jgi:hypothetical protein